MLTQYEKLKAILREMFQMDQADLDFGIYRIMNAKRDEIEKFLDEELLPQVKSEFAKYRGTEIEEKKKELSQLEATLRDSGMNPDDSPKVKGIREELAKYGDDEALTNEVFSHLTSFFRRYYDGGDFLSLRRYKKDTYAIPYEGEEVKLHWANADQYYIKTSEYLKDYTFKLPGGKKAHFKLVEATQEKDNIKAAAGKERKFKLHEDEPIHIEGKEVFIRFVYLPEKEKQDALNKKTVEFINGEATKRLKDFPELFAALPSAKNANRTLWEKHLTSYTARFNFDFFIHKDLGGFLRRELDFYIKNEVLFVDDLDAQDERQLKSAVAKIKVIKHIALKIIAFLAQLEDFQKKLWLKKKFVVNCGYCVTLDRVPEELYPVIAQNESQREEWVRLFAIDEIEGDLSKPGYSKPLTVEFLKANPYLVLDTKHFDEKFREKLLASFDNLDEATDGVLINSENFQALNLLQEKYKEKVKCVYIDPPYNREGDEFVYKDNYKSSSWISMLNQTSLLSYCLLDNEASCFVSCDENEVLNLGKLLVRVYGEINHVETIIWNKRVPKNDKGIGNIHEYVYLFAKNYQIRRNMDMAYVMRKEGIEEIYELVEKAKRSKLTIEDAQKQLKQFYKKQGYDRGITLYCEVDPKFEIWGKINMSWPNPNSEGPRYEIINPITKKPVPIPKKGWRWKEETFRTEEKNGPEYLLPDGSMMKGRVWYAQDENTQPSSITYLREVESFLLRSIISLKSDGSSYLEHLKLSGGIDYPKPPTFIEWLIYSISLKHGYFIDYFSGSGTTGHAIINLNREDGGKRKYILVEMGEYFDTVLKPRIQKVVYSKDWKDGKPVSRDGISHMFKYMYLESYDDTLDNLKAVRTKDQETLLEKMSAGAREDYTLSYMLNIETKASDSLLNIDRFRDPFNYTLKIRRDNELKDEKIDLVETFNYLIGLYVEQTETIRGFKVVRGKLRTGEKTLVIWRNTQEKSNEALDEFFQKQKYNTQDFEFDLIFVNGDNNLENLKVAEDKWKVRLIEEEFQKKMWEQAP